MIGLLGWIILSQALGMGLALGVDYWTWKWRGDEKTVFAVNLMLLLLLLPLGLTTIFQIRIALIFAPYLTVIFLWLMIVALTQNRQYKIGLRAAFFAVLMQFLCFFLTCVVLETFHFFYLRGFMGLNGWLANFWLLSAFLTYALLSLFRPVITDTLRLLKARQTF